MGASNQLLRLTTVSYGDGLSAMNSGVDPVTTAQVVFDQDVDMPNLAGLTDLFVSWGQFVDHDLSLTPDASGEHVFVPGLVAPFERSVYDDTTGTSDARQQINVIEDSMNASQIYGSDATREAELRTFEGGLLGMGEGGLLLLTDTGMAGASEEKNLFLSGDVRANENTGLTVLHNLFSMEHNHWAQKISAIHDDWSDEEIFQAARSIVEYEIQKITYDDWLPHLVGDAVGADTGYDASVDGRVSVEFSTAGFRFGHTMVSPTIKQLDEDGSTSAQGDILVQDAFFNITQLQDNGIEDSLRGLTSGIAQETDTFVVDDLNFFLENPSGVVGFSLPALNILRGQDHGLGSYVDARAELLGDIDPATMDLTDFSIITNDPVLAGKLAETYGTVDQVDLWVGGLAEDDVPGTQLGPLFTFIVADQFTRTRAADESFGDLYQGLDASILAEVSGSSLGDIITRNTDVSYTQEDVFVSANRIGGEEGRDYLVGTSENDLVMGFGGNDTLKGRKGDDAIYGGNGSDKLIGNLGDDMLDGGAGRDRLYGGRHDDMLNGGAGNDKLIGGRGDDIFVFEAGSGRDTICDFGYGDDTIVLSGFGLTDFSDVQDAANYKYGKLYLDFGTDELVLKSVRPWELSADDFSFA